MAPTEESKDTTDTSAWLTLEKHDGRVGFYEELGFHPMFDYQFSLVRNDFTAVINPPFPALSLIVIYAFCCFCMYAIVRIKLVEKLPSSYAGYESLLSLTIVFSFLFVTGFLIKILAVHLLKT